MNLFLRTPVATFFVVLPMLISPLRAATLSKADNTNDLNLATSWSGSVVPGANDIAQWDSTVTAANSTLVGANLSFAGVKVTNPGGAVTFGAGNTITVGTSGIDLSTATQNLTIGSGLTLKGKQNWKTQFNKTGFLRETSLPPVH
jgi:hypothetical protein